MRIYLQLLSLLIVLTGCSEVPKVVVAICQPRTVEATVSGVSSGTVRAERSAELAFGAVGRVSNLYVKLGDTVKAGSLLAEIENADLRIALSRAVMELSRREAIGRGAVSASDMDTARLAVESAKMGLERTLIKAPYDGVITELNLELGQLSQITAVIPKAPIRVTDTGPRYVRVEIDEVDLPRVKVGQPARVKILAIRRETFQAVVRKVVPYVSSIREQDRTTEVELTLDSEGLTLPAGASTDVEIVTDNHEKVLALPSRAVLGRADQRYVFVVRAGTLSRRLVTVGLSNYDFTEIRSGLTEGERIALPSDSVAFSEGLKVATEQTP
jgi:HlyD family secretion protein